MWACAQGCLRSAQIKSRVFRGKHVFLSLHISAEQAIHIDSGMDLCYNFVEPLFTYKIDC